MSTVKSVPIDVLLQFMEVYSKVGDKKINKVIQNYYSWNFTDFVTEVTMAIVCRHFKISEDELLDGNSLKDGTRINAISIYVHLVRENAHLSNAQLAKFLHKRSRSGISKYANIVRSYDDKIPEHKEVLRKLCLIKAELKEQIDIYNNNSKK
jgi:hypothetical protein